MIYEKNGSHFCIEFALRKFDFIGQWSANPKNIGRSKKTQEQTAMKNGGGSLAVSIATFKEAVPPPPNSRGGGGGEAYFINPQSDKIPRAGLSQWSASSDLPIVLELLPSVNSSCTKKI